MKDETEIAITRRKSSSNRRLTAEELAPEGGWGWIVLAGMSLSYTVFAGSVSTFGMVYREFLTETGNDGSALATLNIMFMITFTTAGLVCNELLKRYNIRDVGLLASLLYGVANILVIFMPTVGYMAIAQFLQGIGIGIIICVGTTSLNSYFVKRRALVFTMSQVIVSTATIFYPYLVEHLLSTYGFRGCLSVFSAISLHTICGMLTMEPVEMHYKKPKLVSHKVSANCAAETNAGELSDHAENIDPTVDLLTDAVDCWKDDQSEQSLKARCQLENRKPLLIEASAVGLETGCHPRTLWRGSNQEFFSNRVSLVAATSMASMSTVGGLCNLDHQIIESKTKGGAKVNRGIVSIMADFFEISLLRDRIFVNMSLGMSFISISDNVFHNFLPLILANDGYSMVEIALVLTVSAIAEVTSKICLAVFVMFFKMKARHIYFGSICGLLMSRTAFLYCYTLSNLLIVIAIISFTRSWILITQGLVVAEYVKIERFSAAYGLHGVILGFVQLVVTPVIGSIKDWTKSYAVMQYILLGKIILCIVSWTVQIFVCDILPRYKITVNAETECSKK